MSHATIAFVPGSGKSLHSAVKEFLATSCMREYDTRKGTGDSTNVTLIALDPFCHEQFDDPQNRRPGEKIAMSTDDFMEKLLKEVDGLGGSKALVDGWVCTPNTPLSSQYQPSIMSPKIMLKQSS